MSRRINVTYDGSLIKTLSYDKDGNLQEATMTGYAPVNMDYDIMGRKTKESWTIDGTSYPIDYAYDNVGNVIKITYPDGKIIDLNYYPDARNLVRNIPNLIGTAQTDSFIYNGNSLSTEIRYSNGLNNYKQYDHRSRLITNIYGTTQGDINRKEIQYRYYSSGNIKTIIDGYVNQPLNYAFDGTSKLTSADVPSVERITQTFVYDNAGNRIEDNVNNLYNYS